jgi:hypothetical protein
MGSSAGLIIPRIGRNQLVTMIRHRKLPPLSDQLLSIPRGCLLDPVKLIVCTIARQEVASMELHAASIILKQIWQVPGLEFLFFLWVLLQLRLHIHQLLSSIKWDKKVLMLQEHLQLGHTPSGLLSLTAVFL